MRNLCGAVSPASAAANDNNGSPAGNSGNLTPEHRAKLQSSSKSHPCPICGRTKDGDCRLSDDLILCAYGATHHPPAGIKPGDVIERNGKEWAFAGNTSDDRAATFTIHKPRRMGGTNGGSLQTWSKPQPFDFTLARLPGPTTPPPEHWPNGTRLEYSSTQWVVVRVDAKGKRHLPHHRTADGKAISKAGPDAWPLWQEKEALAHGVGKWISEAEGEKCAEWLRAGGLVAISQPGHAHTISSIEARYQRLKQAGIAGIAYLADNDTEGARKAEKCSAAAAAIDLPFRTVNAATAWPGIAEKGSIDDAPGSAAERCAVFEVAAGQASPVGASIQSSGSDERRHRLKPDEVVELLPKRVGRLRLNLRSGEVETSTGTLSANQIGRLYLQLSSRAETWPKEPTADAVTLLASRDAFDPVAEYLNNTGAEPLPMEQWQQLDQHLLGIDDPIAAAFLPRYLVAAVARVFRPGCSVRQTPVLIGPQWRGKTALGRILFGESHWVEGIGELSRDDLMKAHTAWGVELAELDGVTRRADQERLKAFLTETVDTYRAPYDRAPERHSRRFVFWATSNGPPLRDGTGSTRFVAIPLPDRMLPLQWAAEHRHAIWARAVEQYRAGVDWDACSEEEREAITNRNNNHQEIDPWAELVMPKLSNWETVGGGLPLTLQSVYGWLEIQPERQSNSSAGRIRALLGSAGWSQGRRTVGGKKYLGWWPPRAEQAAKQASGHTGGHTGHTGDTPRCVRANASDANGSQPPDTPDTPNQSNQGVFRDEDRAEQGAPPVKPDADARIREPFSPSGVSGVSAEGKPVAVQGQSPDTPRCVRGVSGVSAVCPDRPITGLPDWADRLEQLQHQNPKAGPYGLTNLLAAAGTITTTARVREVLKLLGQRDA